MPPWRNFCCRWIQSILHSFNPWKISVNWIDKSKSRSNETVTRHSARYKLQKITLSRSTLIFLSNFNASTRHYIEIVSFLCNKLIKCHLSSYDTVFCAFHWTGGGFQFRWCHFLQFENFKINLNSTKANSHLHKV